MLRRTVFALVLLSLVPLAMITTAGSAPTPLLGRYIVVLKDSANVEAVAGKATGLGATVSGLFSSVNTLVVSLPLLGANSLRHDPRVAFVTRDRPVRLLADSPAVSAPSGVNRIGAGPHLNTDGTSTTTSERKAAVAILDTGIMPRADLNVVGGFDCANDLLGTLLGGSGTKDSNGHGTHVSGIVAATDTGQGVVGVSPGTPLYAVRVFSSLGAGSLSNVVCGLDWVAENAAANNIKVVNMSLGGDGTDDGACGTKDEDALHAAVCKVTAAGVTVVVAAGNSKVDLAKAVPAAYDETLAVSAMADFDGKPGGLALASTCDTKGVDDTAADFSDFAVPGTSDVDHTIAAPGVCITSTWNDGKFKSISGTSMASPHVAGVVARCIDAGPCANLSPAQIIAKLRTDALARPADTGFFGDASKPIEGKYFGNLVDASRF